MSLSYGQQLRGSCDLSALAQVSRERELGWSKGHGPKWKELVDACPGQEGSWQLQDGKVTFPELQQEEKVVKLARGLKNWKKGPFQLGETFLDAEWRCDLKWQRLQKTLPSLKDQTVLDIGCNNGYYMYRMLEAGADFVLGIDPTLLFKAQFDFLFKLSNEKQLAMELWGVEHLPLLPNCFDTIFSMGILYHHRSPLQQLIEVRESLVPGGLLVLETIGIEGEGPYSLTPEDRYAGMKNTYFLPTLDALKNWLHKARFTDIELVSDQWQGVEEQRSTEWTSEVSYQDFLDPQDKNKTREGHPAPKRFILFARRKK
jgi:tRNA (mo5U34)-methyltransferase